VRKYDKNFQIGMGPPAADRRLLENEHLDGTCSWQSRVARLLKVCFYDLKLASIFGEGLEKVEILELIPKPFFKN
jgi:hypothetical protein